MEPLPTLELRYAAALDETTLQADWLVAQALIRFRRRSALAAWVVTFAVALAVAVGAAKAGLSLCTGLCALVVLVPVARMGAALLVAVLTGRNRALGVALLANSSLRPAATTSVILRVEDAALVMEAPERTVRLAWAQVMQAEPDTGMGVIVCTTERLGYRVPREAFGEPGQLEALVQQINARARG